MKRTIILVVSIIASTFISWTYQRNQQNESNLSALTLKNIDALASGETLRGCCVDRNSYCEAPDGTILVGYRECQL